MIAQDAHIDWDDYHVEYEITIHWMGKVEPYGTWETIAKYTYNSNELLPPHLGTLPKKDL